MSIYKKTYTTKFPIQIRESYHLSQQEKKLVIDIILLIKTMGKTMGKRVSRDRNTRVQAKVHMSSSTTTELLKFKRQ